MGDTVHYGEPFYLTTTSDSPAPNQGLSTCQTFVAEPKFLINFITPDDYTGLKLKFVSADNKIGPGEPVQRNHNVLISLYDDGSQDNDGVATRGLFYIGGNSSKNFKFRCNKYITVHQELAGDDTNIPKGSEAVVNVKTQNGETGSSAVLYGSTNLLGMGNKYFAYCDDLETNDGCPGPALAWKKNGDGSQLKFILHRFPENCVELGKECDSDLMCCSRTEGAMPSDGIGCFKNVCKFCNNNGGTCDGNMECCSGICGLRDGIKVCKPYKTEGDSCTNSSECGTLSDGLVCSGGKCKKCEPDATPDSELYCSCLPTSASCDQNGGDRKCCAGYECLWDSNVKGYACMVDMPVVIPVYAWVVIIAIGILLMLLFYFLLRLYKGGQKYLKKQKKDMGLYDALPNASNQQPIQ